MPSRAQKLRCFSDHRAQLISRPDVSPELFEAYRCCALRVPFTATVRDHAHFLHCCHRHGLIVDLYENLRSFGSSDPELETTLTEAYRDQFLSYAQYLTVLKSLDEAMGNKGLEVVLLKGAALWFSCYRDLPMSRHVSDIDMLVRPEDRDALVALLHRRGFMGDPSGKTFKDSQQRIVDLHCDTLGVAENSSGVTVDAVWKGSRPLEGYSSLRLMDPELEIHYLALHALKHSFLRFSWLRDVALLCQHGTARKPGSAMIAKMRDWSLYLHESLLCETPSPRGLNSLERHLAVGMLCDYKHPLGKFLVALYQPGIRAKAVCLAHLIQRPGDRKESMLFRLWRLFGKALTSTRKG